MSVIPEVRWYKPRSRWAIRVRGVRHYFPKDATKGEAQAEARLLLVLARYPIQSITVAEVSDLWVRSQSERLSASAIKGMRAFTKAVGRFTGRNGPAGQVKPHEVRAWLIQQGTGRKRSTLNMWLWSLKSAYRWGVEQGIVEWEACYRLSQARNIRQGEAGAESEKRRPPGDHEIAAVRGQLTLCHLALFDLMLCTGARCGELLALTGDQIDRSLAPWVYRPVKHKNAHKGIPRVILLGPEARVIVSMVLSSEIQFTSYQGFYKALRLASERAGFEPITPHQLRHKAATVFRLKYGVDKAKVLLGHSSATQTDDYSWTVQEQIGEFIERVD